jgi:predicted NodU family carbamoyl transferase
MKAVHNAARNFNVAGELLSYFSSKRWWLQPIAQSVLAEHTEKYFELLNAQGTVPRATATSIPVLLYTSFNLKGEPIVNTPTNSFNTFSISDMDALVLENFLIEKAV